jgi:hypothetical protein
MATVEPRPGGGAGAVNAPEAAAAAPARWRIDTPARAVLFGVGVALGFEAAHLALTLAFVETPSGEWLLARGNYRVGVIVSLITGLTAGALVYAFPGHQRELEQYRRALGWSEARLAEAIVGVQPSRRSLCLAAFALAPAGLLLITASDTSRPFLFTDDPWTPSIVWAMAQNVVLFALLGAVAYLTHARRRVDRALEAYPPPLDLLDPAEARALAATGLRRSFFWIVGGSFASLVLVDLDFSWMTGVVVGVTLAIGTGLFFTPLVKLARRIRAAKHAELERVRRRIREARDALLEHPAPSLAVTSELPALLAWEKRIEEVRPFALDASQVLRFASLVVLALGSWLGGAIVDLWVERVLR